MVAPGQYSVELFVENNGQLISQGTPRTFLVKPIPTLDQGNFEEIAEFQQKTRTLLVDITSVGQTLSETQERLRFIEAALRQTPGVTELHFQTWRTLNRTLADLQNALYGDPARRELDESRLPGISDRVRGIASGHWETTQPPTDTFKQNLNKAEVDFEALKPLLSNYLSALSEFENQLRDLGTPYTRGCGY